MAASSTGDSENALGFLNLPQTFANVLETNKLPVVVQIDGSQAVLVSPEFDPQTPLVVHSKHRSRRIIARCVKFNVQRKEVADVGCDAIIPSVYEGWFAVLGNPSDKNLQLVVPHFRRISQLAISFCSEFLLAGDRPLNAYRSKTTDDDHITLLPHQIPPGSILRKRNLLTVSTPVIKKKGFRKKEQVQEDTFLSCGDSAGNTYLISCEEEGIFYVMTSANATKQVPIMRTTDIVDRFNFPVLVKLIHGYIPPPPQDFDGAFIFFTSESAMTAVAHMINVRKDSSFEIRENSSLQFFSRTLENGELQEYNDKIKLYEKKSFYFSQNLHFQYNCLHLPDIEAFTGGDDYSEVVCSDDAAITEPRATGGLDICCRNVEEIILFSASRLPDKDGKEKNNTNYAFKKFNINQIKRSVMYDRPKDKSSQVITSQAREFDENASVISCSNSTHSHSTHSHSTHSHSESISSSSSLRSQTSVPDVHSDVEGSSNQGHSDSLDGRRDSNSYLQDDHPYFQISSSHSIKPVRVDKFDSDGVYEQCESLHAFNDGGDYETTATLSGKYEVVGGKIQLVSPVSPISPVSPVSLSDASIPSASDYKSSIKNPGYVSSKYLSGSSSGYVDILRLSNNSIDTLYATLDDVIYDQIGSEKQTKSGIDDSSFLQESAQGVDDPSETRYQNIIEMNDSVKVTSKTSDYKYTFSLPMEKEFEGDDVPSEHDTPERIYQNIPSPTSLETGRRHTLQKDKDGYLLPQVMTGQTSKANAEKSHVTPPQPSGTCKRQEEFLEQMKELGVKKNTFDALLTLDYSDFLSILEADDRIERFNELLPGVPKSDIFKIGLGLKKL